MSAIFFSIENTTYGIRRSLGRLEYLVARKVIKATGPCGHAFVEANQDKVPPVFNQQPIEYQTLLPKPSGSRKTRKHQAHYLYSKNGYYVQPYVQGW
jgi:hypothetical protein